MKIKYAGQYVRIEDDWDAVRSLKCSCGHLLSEHYFHNLEGSADWIEVGGCKTNKQHCNQFQMSRIRFGGARNYA